MNLPEACIRRPVMTTLMMATIMHLGLFGFKLAGRGPAPGRFPDHQRQRDACPAPARRRWRPRSPASSSASFASISGITSMSSVSSAGHERRSRMQFDLNRNIDGARSTCRPRSAPRRRAAAARTDDPAQLPEGEPGRPAGAVHGADFCDASRSTSVHEYGEITSCRQMSQLPGVAQVNIYGAQKYAVRVQAEPRRRLGPRPLPGRCPHAIARSELLDPVGTLNGTKQRMVLGATGQMERGGDYGQIISQKNGVADPPRTTWRRSSTRVENDQIAQLVQRSSARSCSVYRSPTPTPFRSSMQHQEPARRLSRAIAGRDRPSSC
jgi:HAE1 family hydrophobic/amphiphilic exporter-1